MSKKTDQNDWEEFTWYQPMCESCNSSAVIEGIAYFSNGYQAFKCRCTLCGKIDLWIVSEEQAFEFAAASARKGAVAHTDERFDEIAAEFYKENFSEIVDAERLDPMRVFLMRIGSKVVIVTMDLNRKRSFDEFYGDSRKRPVKLAQVWLVSTG